MSKFLIFFIIVYRLSLIILILELWYFWNDAEYEEISPPYLFFIEIITTIFVFLFLLSPFLKLPFIGLFLVLIPPILWEFFKKKDWASKEKSYKKEKEKEIEKINVLIQTTNNPTILYKAYYDLGEIYYKTQDFEKALDYYKKAKEISDKYKIPSFPGLDFKIKISEKEDKIKKGLLWVCPECGFDNEGNSIVCKSCNFSKNLIETVKKDLKKHQGELKYEISEILTKGAIWLIGIHFFCSFLIILAYLFKILKNKIGLLILSSILISVVLFFLFLKISNYVQLKIKRLFKIKYD